MLVGFSMGGGEVARYMSRHAGKGVVKAALVSSVVPFMLETADNPDGTESSAFAAMTQVMTADRAKFFGDFFNNCFGVEMISSPVSDELLAWARTVAMQAGLPATLGGAKSRATTEFRPGMAAFKVLPLNLYGAADKAVPISAAGRAAAQKIAGSIPIKYEDAPNRLFATHKTKLTQDLLNFLGH